MRLLIIFTLFTLLTTSCVSFPERTSKLYSGLSELEVRTTLGEPKEVRNQGSRRIYLYLPTHGNYSYPFLCQFDDGKLTAWGAPKEQEQQARANASADAQREQAAAQVLMNYSNQANQQRQSGGQVDANCVQQCLGMGSMLDYCNKACSY